MGKSTNPTQMLMSMLPQNSRNLISGMSSKTTMEQAQKVADLCNKNGITKEQLSELVSLLSNRNGG